MNPIDKSELTDSEFEDILNELYPPVDICGMSFDSGRALKELDPIAFQCAKAEYEDTTQKWECGKCSKDYDNEDDAEECCKEDTSV